MAVGARRRLARETWRGRRANVSRRHLRSRPVSDISCLSVNASRHPVMRARASTGWRLAPATVAAPLFQRSLGAVHHGRRYLSMHFIGPDRSHDSRDIRSGSTSVRERGVVGVCHNPTDSERVGKKTARNRGKSARCSLPHRHRPARWRRHSSNFCRRTARELPYAARPSTSL
jgi:hypothetical protein